MKLTDSPIIALEVTCVCGRKFTDSALFARHIKRCKRWSIVPDKDKSMITGLVESAKTPPKGFFRRTIA